MEVTPVPLEDLTNAPLGEPSASIRERVIAARAIQTERFKDVPGVYCNAQMSSRLLEQYAQLDAEGSERLGMAMKALDLSARAYERIRKVARTIADLDGAEFVGTKHVSEAVGYRNLDRGGWGE